MLDNKPLMRSGFYSFVRWLGCLFTANGGGSVEVEFRLFIKTAVKIKNKNHPTTVRLIFPFFSFFFLHSSKWVERPENRVKLRPLRGMSSSQEHQKPQILFINLAITSRACLFSCSQQGFLFLFLRLLELWWINDALFLKFTPVEGFWLMEAGF